MKMNNKFVVFILTHGRANRQYTYATLKKSGYTGQLYFIIDNEDSEEIIYRKLYGEKVISFNKLEISKNFDTADNFNDRRTIVYARNACYDIAKELGYRYFVELDDDYTAFNYRYKKGDHLASEPIKNLDDVFDATFDFYKESKAKVLAYAQAGDSIGGINAVGGGAFRKKILRKAMNVLFLDTENPVQFVGRINEDVNSYCYYGSKGDLFMTITDISINQMQTQSNKGGMTDIYLDSGTYIKSIYSVIFCPSFVTIDRIGGNTYHRIHHRIEWKHGVPLILNEKWKKERDHARQT